VKELEDLFRSQDIEWITLGVFSKNVEARAVYEQIGFRDVYTFMGKRLENGPRLPGEPPPYGRPRARP
jgi:ribosomal protein S18 acetylase RimI-like enzyme